MMEKGRVILDSARFELTASRLCYELIERYQDFKDTCIIGIQPRGVYLSDYLLKTLAGTAGVSDIEYGKLDITFYRDDFRMRDKPIVAQEMVMNFLVDDKHVILVDDVLYTGRTVQSALTALNHFGRPASVELLALVDRRFNRHLPIEAHYTGIVVDALDDAYVRVSWEAMGDSNEVRIFSGKTDSEY